MPMGRTCNQWVTHCPPAVFDKRKETGICHGKLFKGYVVTEYKIKQYFCLPFKSLPLPVLNLFRTSLPWYLLFQIAKAESGTQVSSLPTSTRPFHNCVLSAVPLCPSGTGLKWKGRIERCLFNHTRKPFACLKDSLPCREGKLWIQFRIVPTHF